MSPTRVRHLRDSCSVNLAEYIYNAIRTLLTILAKESSILVNELTRILWSPDFASWRTEQYERSQRLTEERRKRMPKQPPQTDIEKMIATMAEGRQLVVELHTAVRDAKQAMKELRSLRSELLSREELRDRLNTITEEQLRRYMSEVDSAITKATDAVNDRFDTIMMICMGEDPLSVKEGKRTTIELIKDYVYAKKLPIHITEEVYVLVSPEIKQSGDKHPGIIARGGLGRLPLVVDHRVPKDMLYLVIPEIGGHPPEIIEVNIKTGDGVEKSRERIRDYDSRREALIPDAFKKGEGLEPA